LPSLHPSAPVVDRTLNRKMSEPVAASDKN